MNAFDLSSFIIIFRETLEAALIVGITASFLARTRNLVYLPHVLWSTAAALVASAAVAVLFDLTVGEFRGRSSAVFEGAVALLAAGVLTYMVLWMKRQAVQIRPEMENRLGEVLQRRDVLALCALPFFAVLREGAESVLFLKAAALQAGGSTSLAGGILGFFGAILLTAAIFWFGKRIPLKPFFQSTGIFLLIISAGLLAYGVHELEEAGLINPVIEHVWNVNPILNEKTGAGAFLKAIFGYNGNPSLVEVSLYAGYLSGMLFWMRRIKPAAAPSKNPVPGASSMNSDTCRKDHMKHKSKKTMASLLVLLFFIFSRQAGAYEEAQKGPENATQELNVVEVKAPRGLEGGPFLPAVQGTRINAGKKTSAVNLSDPPAVTNNNYRQALAKTPGLLISEETTPLVSIGYRGLNPDRAQFIQVMKDGIPITADMFGYPEAYYTPLLQTVEQIEFIRGGSALMYGPQPGGALNYVTRSPAADKNFEIHSENAFGSDAYFSTYEALTGTVGPVGYLGYFHERQGDGFRSANSDFEVISGGLKVTLNQTSDSRLTLNYEEYHEEHGEPGGLSLSAASNLTYEQDRNFATRLYDRFRLERYYASLLYEKDISETTLFEGRVFGGHYRRWSKRQRGGGFGTVPSGGTANSNDIQEQDFYNIGYEPRIRHDYELLGQTHTLSVGAMNFFSSSPRVESRGASPSADTGLERKQSERQMYYLSLFMENLFRLGKLSLTPGVRFEHIWQSIQEKLNLDKTSVPYADEKDFSFVPLMGIGAAYEVAPAVEVYANISQSYRPKAFADAVPLGTNQVVASDLEEGRGEQYDFGVRGRAWDFWTWDADYFLLDFQSQTGTVGNSIQNVGDARHHGIELASEVDLTGFWDRVKKTDLRARFGSISPFTSLTLLDAEFYGGANEERAPAFTPKYNLRFGVGFDFRGRMKLKLQSTFVADHFADDAGTLNRKIPSYKVWDLTGEVHLLEDVKGAFDISLFGGINNLFDEEYYARITSAGIDPAYGRNVYGGVKIKLG